jgi:hypothetical protein
MRVFRGRLAAALRRRRPRAGKERVSLSGERVSLSGESLSQERESLSGERERQIEGGRERERDGKDRVLPNRRRGRRQRQDYATSLGDDECSSLVIRQHVM